MNEKENNNVLNFRQNDPEALARVVGMTDSSERVNSTTGSSSEKAPRSANLLKKLGVGALIGAGILWIAGPRIGADDAPKEEPTSTELYAESAQDPYNPSKEAGRLLIDGITVNSNDNNPHNDTPSEAVMDASKVYLEQHPESYKELYESAVSLPQVDKFAVVLRDVDKDGTSEAIAAPAE